MIKLVSILSLLIACRAMAQCDYPVTLRTNKDYCVGSSLIASSSHAFQSITWYKNGNAVSTVYGIQSLAAKPSLVQIYPDANTNQMVYDYSDLGTDDAGNIYVLDNNSQVYKTTPAGQVSLVVDYGALYNSIETEGLFVSPAGDVYNVIWYNSAYASDSGFVQKVPAGVTVTDTSMLTTIIPKSASGASAALNNQATSLYLDCAKNIYVWYVLTGNVVRWTPGAAAGTLVAQGQGENSGCAIWDGIGRVHVDPVGNIFFLDGTGVKKMAPGAAAPVTVVPGGCVSVNSRLVGDFWMDAADTIYMPVFENVNYTFSIEKWAPGASVAQIITTTSLGKNWWGGRLPITMDARGNLLVAVNSGPNVYKYSRTTSIDSSFTPGDTGTYYAVTRDIRGYTSTSDTIHINTPAPPASISITATATSTPVCAPITFTATPVNSGYGTSFQWEVSGVPAGGDSTSYSYNLFADGDQVYCIMSTQTGCIGPQKDTSNLIYLSIDPHGTATVAIATPKDAICKGDRATFEATVINGSNQPVFEWLLNGDSTGDETGTYTPQNLLTGDVITCLITSDNMCGLAKSNSIAMTVSTPPTVQSGQVVTILHGHSQTLDPVITGDVVTYQWTPAAGLSDPTIPDPVAAPSATTLYTLKVTAAGGCSDSGTILVDVYTPLSVPGAFTPNGDGHNDVFYVLAGPVNSEVEDFAVYDRYGAEVFQVHDVAAGDPSHGWNGYFHGTPAPVGTYVYFVRMAMADGSRQIYKGTVILIR